PVLMYGDVSFPCSSVSQLGVVEYTSLCACAGAFQTPLRARDNCIGVGALSRHRRWRGLGAFVCDGIARETVEGRGAVSGSLPGMFPARRRSVGLVIGGKVLPRTESLGEWMVAQPLRWPLISVRPPAVA